MTAGVCQYCTCQGHTPCAGGCAWTDESQTLCTTCLSAEMMAEMAVRTLTASGTPLNLVASTWAELSHEQKQLLVMTMRTVYDRVLVAALQDLREDAAVALDIVSDLQELIVTRYPDAVRPDDTLVDTVARLIGPRLVVP